MVATEQEDDDVKPAVNLVGADEYSMDAVLRTTVEILRLVIATRRLSSRLPTRESTSDKQCSLRDLQRSPRDQRTENGLDYPGKKNRGNHLSYGQGRAI